MRLLPCVIDSWAGRYLDSKTERSLGCLPANKNAIVNLFIRSRN